MNDDEELIDFEMFAQISWDDGKPMMNRAIARIRKAEAHLKLADQLAAAAAADLNDWCGDWRNPVDSEGRPMALINKPERELAEALAAYLDSEEPK